MGYCPFSRSIHAMRKSTIPRSALAEPLRYAQSARLGRVPMGCGPAYAALTPLGGGDLSDLHPCRLVGDFVPFVEAGDVVDTG